MYVYLCVRKVYVYDREKIDVFLRNGNICVRERMCVCVRDRRKSIVIYCVRDSM